MAKIRVHELSKQLNISNKDIIDTLGAKGIEIKSHMSNLDDSMVAIVKSKFSGAGNAPKQAAAKTETPKQQAKPVVPKQEPKQQIKPQTAAETVKTQTVRTETPKQQQTKAETPRQTSAREDNQAARQGAGNHVRFAREDKNSGKMNNNGNRVRFNNDRQGGTDRARFSGDRNQNDRNQGDRPRFNRDGQGDRNQGDRPRFNRDGQGDRPRFNRDGQGDRNQGDRPRFNRDGQGDRPRFNRDGQGDRNQGDRPRFNRDGQGDRNQGDRPRFNRDGQGDRNQGGGRFGRDGGDRNQGGRGFGRDGGNRFSNRINMPFGKDDEDDSPAQKRAPFRRDRKDFDAKEMPGKDLKSQNRDNYNRDKNKPRKGNRRSPEEVEADISRLAKNVKSKPQKKQQTPQEDPDAIRTITLPETVTLKDLADAVKTPVTALIKKLFLAGKMVNVNSEFSFDEASEIALEYNCIAEEEEKVDVIEELLKEDEEDEKDMVSRPPVVCVMGHVDHGKTSLLDAIRQTKVTSGEAGGITQAIGASVVDVNGQTITFLDTPGHEAFTAMRMRGAQSTDIAILVVAADDGVMPQTVEAINHAKAAGIEIIVAINKIDKESANIERVKQELTEYELIPEDWGGSTIFCPVSAHTKEGIDNLLEMILLTADVLELKANPNRKARGIVIEAELDKGRGPVATMLVQKGTLHVGDYIAVGASHGKVRAMTNSRGERVTEALPSTPVQIQGLNTVPDAGEIFMAVDNEKEARTISETYISQGKEKLLADTKQRMSLDDLYSQIQAGNLKELKIIIKADVQGSVEAVKQSLLKLSNDEVVIKCIHAGVGAINESDIILASASNAIVIGFNIRPDARAKDMADSEGVDVRLYRVIYNAIEDIDSAMKGMLDPIYEEKVIGHAEIRQTYKASGIGVIAGSYVLDGTINRNCSVRITREGNLIFEGKLASLKRFKDDVKEVKSGFECGMVFENFQDVAEEDQIEAYEMVEVPRK
ncbi:translation initiation factor IF-2 [Coprococcus eutactus]|uniref:translation initiation factor IF-2 n=1 Tax=Coprococcus eutactus TaxID=33043 RepID=UPI001C012885|nr:translation initiation factor IF-2 [Coprococcus eutactus]MBT9755080.1 translation initiation factor IF-2 [Coprococcus eutactus]